MMYDFEMSDFFCYAPGVAPRVRHMTAFQACTNKYHNLRRQIISRLTSHVSRLTTHSLLNDFTGLANAALTAWKLTVSNAMTTATAAAAANIHHAMVIR